MRRPILLALAAAVVLAAGYAAAATLAHGSPARSDAGTAVVKLRKTALGRILVDARGRTLYLFEADKGRRSVCYGKCASFWPPLLAKGKPTAGTGVKASRLGTVKRKNGTKQVTYAGHPLYRFKLDKSAGQTNGEGQDFFGGKWWGVSAAGRAVKHTSTTSTTTNTTTTSPTTTYCPYGC